MPLTGNCLRSFVTVAEGGKPTVHQNILGLDAGGQDATHHIRQVSGGLLSSLTSPLVGEAAFIHNLFIAMQPFLAF